MSMSIAVSIAQLVAALVAILALIVTANYSRRSIIMAERTLEQSSKNAQEALSLSFKQSFDFQGGQLCAAYRDQVLRLHELGCTPEQIKHWFKQEDASEYPNAYEAFADGCGSVEELVSILPQLNKTKKTPGTQSLHPTSPACSLNI
jgi:hypothetical protein